MAIQWRMQTAERVGGNCGAGAAAVRPLLKWITGATGAVLALPAPQICASTAAVRSSSGGGTFFAIVFGVGAATVPPCPSTIAPHELRARPCATPAMVSDRGTKACLCAHSFHRRWRRDVHGGHRRVDDQDGIGRGQDLRRPRSGDRLRSELPQPSQPFRIFRDRCACPSRCGDRWSSSRHRRSCRPRARGRGVPDRPFHRRLHKVPRRIQTAPRAVPVPRYTRCTGRPHRRRWASARWTDGQREPDHRDG